MLSDIINTLLTLLASKFNLKNYTENQGEGFDRPSFFIDFITDNKDILSQEVYEKDYQLQIVYFAPVDDYHNIDKDNQYSTYDALCKLFEKPYFLMGNRAVKITNFTGGPRDAEIYLTLTLSITDQIENTTTAPLAGNVVFNLDFEGGTKIMALGLPQMNIIFEQAGVTAIQRGQRGIVALILKDATNNGLLIMNGIEDMPSNLSAYNQAQIEDAWIGYVNPPLQVIAFIEATTATDYSLAEATLEGTLWDYLAVPGISATDAATMAPWVTGLKDNKGKRVKAVLPHVAGNHEAIINFSTDNIVIGSITHAATDKCARIAGLLAGTPLNMSATYAVLSEVTDVPHLTNTQFNTNIAAGQLVLMNDGKKVKIARSVNSLTTLTTTKGSDWQKIKLVDIMDQIYTDITGTIADNYTGKYPCDYDHKCLLITAILGYFDGLEAALLVDKNSTSIGIDLDAQKAYLKTQGIDITTMKDQDIKEYNTGDTTFIGGNTKILDAMEDFQFNIGI